MMDGWDEIEGPLFREVNGLCIRCNDYPVRCPECIYCEDCYNEVGDEIKDMQAEADTERSLWNDRS